MAYDLLDRTVLWHRSADDNLAHLQPVCPQRHAGEVTSPLADLAVPGRWCYRCARSVWVLLDAWRSTAGTSGPARLVAARLGHPVLQDPARWLLAAVEHGVCAEPARATRWVAVVDGRVGAWLEAAAAGDLARHGFRLAVLDGPVEPDDVAAVACLWDPDGGGLLADPARSLATARALAG